MYKIIRINYPDGSTAYLLNFDECGDTDITFNRDKAHRYLDWQVFTAIRNTHNNLEYHQKGVTFVVEDI